MKIKEFFYSFNLRNNKILNAKTELPTHKDHIANKEFVDSKTIYDTPKVTQYINPFKLQWVTNPKNKNILQILDDLFFPLVNPEYINPKFDVFVTRKKNPNIVFINTINTGFEINWSISSSDRPLNQAPKIVITKLDNSVTNIVADSTSLTGKLAFNIDWVNISKIEFVAVFNPTNITKQDSYGNNFVPPDFQTIYNLKHNILLDIQTNNLVVPAIFYRNIEEDEDLQIIIDATVAINTSANLIANINYNRTNKTVIVKPGSENFKILLVPKIVYDNYKMFLADSLLTDTILSIKQTTTIDNVEYYLTTIDLGYYENQSTLKIDFSN